MPERAPFNAASEPDRMLAAIVDSSDDAIIGKDLDGVVVTWNRAAERLYGYSAAEMLGQPIARLIPESHTGEFSRILETVRSGRRVSPFETVRRAKDGRLVSVTITVSPIHDAAGHVVGAATIARDITALKRDETALHNSEARWGAIVASAIDGIVVIDARGVIEAFNPAAERLFGYPESEMVGRNVSALMPSPDRERHDTYIARYLTTADPHIIGSGREVHALRRDGTLFPVHLAVGEMRIDGTCKFVGIIHDLSARVRLEERLREQAAMARLGEMAAVVAHEIKNPLAGIRGAVQVIGGRLAVGSPESAVASEIVERIDSLNLLVKDLLVFARPPQPRLTVVNPRELVTSTAQFLQRDPAMQAMAITVEGTSAAVDADADLMRIVIVNIMVNAAQATSGKGRLDIQLQDQPDGVQIAFRDDGPGIPDDVRDKVFTPFFTTKSRGTGLGLSTAKNLVEAQGGAMSLECPPDGGTRVMIRLRPATRLPEHSA